MASWCRTSERRTSTISIRTLRSRTDKRASFAGDPVECALHLGRLIACDLWRLTCCCSSFGMLSSTTCDRRVTSKNNVAICCLIHTLELLNYHVLQLDCGEAEGFKNVVQQVNLWKSPRPCEILGQSPPLHIFEGSPQGYEGEGH